MCARYAVQKHPVNLCGVTPAQWVVDPQTVERLFTTYAQTSIVGCRRGSLLDGTVVNLRQNTDRTAALACTFRRGTSGRVCVLKRCFSLSPLIADIHLFLDVQWRAQRMTQIPYAPENRDACK